MSLKMPDRNTWVGVRQALEDALKLENDLNDYIHKIHSVGEHICQDPHVI